MRKQQHFIIASPAFAIGINAASSAAGLPALASS
jgi:hypothetical protein